jgi:hypothetical protein
MIGLVESRMHGNGHVRFGGADRGNGWPKHHTAPWSDPYWLVHEGGYTVISSGDGFEFYRRDGTLVPKVRDQKEYSDELPGIATEPEAICSEWLGDAMNLGYVIGALVEAEDRGP